MNFINLTADTVQLPNGAILPPAAETLYIVPAVVRQTAPERSDLASPSGSAEPSKVLRQGAVSVCAELVVNF